MSGQFVTERLAEALVRANTQESVRPKAERGTTIAISREVGARGSSVAREVGRRLGWPVYDHELLEQVARELNVNTSLLDSVDEKQKSWLLEQFETFSAVPHVSKNAFVMKVVETVLLLGVRGECVIVGRGAAHILPAATTLRVRLIAHLEDRVDFVSREWNLPRNEAARRVENEDRERNRFIKDHFHKDPASAANYDLVISTSRFSVPQTAELVIEGLKQFPKPVAEQLPAASAVV